ncbi:hypothetical protein Q9G26_000288 [Escherichia coli]|nr:hypothetical protein [Escherichia coli]
MIKDLVASGHALADDMTGAPSVLVRCLATQLEVQLVRANALAAENVALRSKAAELAHEASKIYSAYNATITEPDGDFMDMQTLHEMQCIETPATDAFLAEVRAQGVEMFAECAYTLEHHDHAVAFAAELREGGNQ